MNNLTKLLFLVRTNKYFVTSDIKHAYLQIRLKHDYDKNKFSILWQNKNGILRAFKYASIVFGFVTSSWILNYVIKHHIDKFPNDHCSNMLKTMFYVDNLFLTGNSVAELQSLYKDCFNRMLDGGFELRSWVSNSETLNADFQRDGTCANHDSDCEKILGYSYYPRTDEIQLSDLKFEHLKGIVTKRIILSVLAQIFDPLGLYLPVVVRVKILLREVWKENYDWDQEIDGKLAQYWHKILNDLIKLPSIRFDRKTRLRSGN